MATYTNPIVTARAAGTINRPNEYGGVTKSVPVSITIDSNLATADVLVLSGTFGQNSKLVDFHLTNSDLAASGDIVVTAGSTTVATIAATTAATARMDLAPVDISGGTIYATAGTIGTGTTGTIVGTLFYTDDW